MKDNALIIFSRLPVGHEVKTRLAPLLNDSQREGLMLAMWHDVFSEVIKLPDSTQIFLYWTGTGDINDYKKFIPERFILCRQSEGSLGVRMFNAINQVLESGCKRVALIGSDVPLIKHEYILEAFAMLDNYDCVLAPSLDGGYWLTAMSRALHEVFNSDSWGTSSVLESARKNIHNAGLTLGLAHELDDLDTPDDIKNFMKETSNKFTRTYKYIASLDLNFSLC
ncbi:MAG: TIGR04282 family arsenosugar biosynthesis glycosyltransferase [Synergistaceae bacterium]|nr:TIGR04282 family arsenosugar biosynthesis glycosyltransferase [Synergistaceae bacterium]